MNKKGFTLVELLAVIAILAILVIIALPNVMGMFNTAKENSFRTEVKEVFKTAEQKWIQDSMYNTGEQIYSRCTTGCTKNLDLSGRSELSYYIKLNKAGEVTKYCATDGTFQYYYEGQPLKIENINSVDKLADSNVKKLEIKNNNCKKEVIIPPSDNMLMTDTSNGHSASENYLRTEIKRNEIEKITFVNSISGHSSSDENCWDLSVGNNGSVLAWATYNDETNLYDLTIGTNEEKVFLKDGNRLFLYLVNLKSFEGLEYFDTSQVTDMSYMFQECDSLESLDLRTFDTSNVKKMVQMFYDCNLLTDIDLSNFDTENLESMTYMFGHSRSLKDLDLSSFETPKLNNIVAAFRNCTSLETIDISNINTSKVTNMDLVFIQCPNLKTIYTSDKFDVSKVTSSQDMFHNDTQLVGGSGTVYDPNHYGVEYAHIDGGPSNPGYFTRK